MREREIEGEVFAKISNKTEFNILNLKKKKSKIRFKYFKSLIKKKKEDCILYFNLFNLIFYFSVIIFIFPRKDLENARTKTKSLSTSVTTYDTRRMSI